MKTFFHHIQALWNMPHRFRSSYVRHAMTVAGYRILCKLKGEEFTAPPQAPIAGNYVITKYIPSVGFTLFGKRYQFTREIPLEYVPSDSDLARQIVEQTQGPVRYACFVYASRNSSDEYDNTQNNPYA
jgi:hypothetical protein